MGRLPQATKLSINELTTTGKKRMTYPLIF
jgi:hypothetical protein